MEKTFTPKTANFVCEDCNFKCFKNSDWIRHTNSDKHQYRVNGNIKEKKVKKENAEYACKCGKKYGSYSGLWKHNKVCKINDDNSNDNNIEKTKISIDKDEIIMLLLKENSEFKKMMIEQQNKMMIDQQNMLIEQQNMMLKIMEKGINNTDSHDTTTTTHTNSHNKAFNLQFYLNETCKNAMNLSEFIDSINPQLSDLMSIGELGYVEGISKIIIDNLNKLDFTERPINCTDKKRDTMYIKDDNKWEKDEENQKLNKAVKKVAYKNTRLFPQYKQKYPDYGNAESKHSDQYSTIVIESLKDDRENNDKVIKNISKVTTIKEK